MGPKRTVRSCLQLSDKRRGDERGRRVFTMCTTGRQSSKAVVPTASFRERVDVQICTLGDQIAQVKPGVDSHATHAHADQAAGPRGCGRGDHGGADESCAMVSSLTEEVQQREESRQLCRMWS